MIIAKYVSFKSVGVTHINGTILKDFILINSDIPKEEQRNTLHHEMLHFLLGHTDGSRKLTAEEAEREINSIMQ